MVDDETKAMNIYEFYELGVGDPIACSGIHGVGTGDILDACIALLPEETLWQIEMLEAGVAGLK